MILYPALDLLDGRAVRLTRGDYAQVRVYSEDPGGVLASFRAAGASCAHLVDLNGARDPAERQQSILEPLLKGSGLKVQVGGGVRSRADAEQLLAWGADRVVIGSVAILDPKLGEGLLKTLGGERVTFALDYRWVDDGKGHGRAHVAIKGWKETSKIELTDVVERYRPAGLARILCTDISRDGTAAGPHDAMYKVLVARFPGLEVQASGGVRNLGDLANLKRDGAHSAIVGTALYERTLDLKEALAAC
ncbi:MAG: 1-(5-phosphoribosyl)-5-[(5-phosphoribosylamino)methylideneamino] imidazole-4-carboxamide isomerase [Elusimicrobiota bacterium]